MASSLWNSSSCCSRASQFHGSLKELATPEHFQRFLRQLFSKDGVVYAKPPFGGPEHVLNYLARYTQRVAISNHRLVAFKDERVLPLEGLRSW